MFAGTETAARRSWEIRPKRSPFRKLAVRRYTSSTRAWLRCQTLARLSRFKRSEGVVFIGVAQEKDRSFRSRKRLRRDGSVASFDFYRGQVMVNHYYFPSSTSTRRSSSTSRMLPERIALLLDPGPRGYSHGPMTNDLYRLRLQGLVLRLPGKLRYVVTPMDRRVALFFSKAFARILRPGLARIDPELPPDSSDRLATAWRLVDRALDLQIHKARLRA